MTFGAAQAPPGTGTATPTHGTETPATGDAQTTAYRYVVTAISATGEESTPNIPFDNYTSGGGYSRIMSTDGNAFMTLNWAAPAGTAPASYNIYRQGEVPNSIAPAGALFGLIGSSTGTSYVDRDNNPDFGTAPPQNAIPFSAGNYPGCVAYFLERLWFAASGPNPDKIWCSQPGNFTNFNVTYPVTASDAITESLLSTQINAIKCLVPMPSGMIAGTAGGAWLLSGGSVGSGGIPASITPSDITAQPQASNGFSDVPPIVINYDVVFIQNKQSIVRDLSYNFYVNIYTGTDMTTLSNHLFSGRSVREWSYAEEPFKLIWAVQDNGALLCLTYLKEQDVYGWSRHDTLGLFQSVCTVSEGNVDATYFVVLRPLNGVLTYTIERLADRALLDGSPAFGIPANIESSWCVDCGLSLPQPAPVATLFPGYGATAAGAAGIVFSTDTPVFSAGNVGSVLRGNGGWATITAYVSPIEVVATVKVPFPPFPNDPTLRPIQIAPNQWTMTAPVSTVSGLDALNGMTVSILADGNVMPQQVVAGGSVTLLQPASSVIVGLPYTCQLQTLYLDTGEPTSQGKRKKVNAVSIRAKDSRGLQAGRTPATCVDVKQWSEQRQPRRPAAAHHRRPANCARPGLRHGRAVLGSGERARAGYRARRHSGDNPWR